RVLVFALGVTLLAGITAGLLPALRSTQIAPTDALKAQARQAGGGGGRRGAVLGKALVVAQIAFCVLLLVVAGLFVRSMQSLLRTDVGFDRGHILVGRLDVRSLGYTNAQRQALYERIIDRLQRVPGVTAVSLSLNGPLGTSQRSSSLSVEGYTPGPREELQTNEEIITAGYFDAVGLRMVEGRAFTTDDGQPGRRSSIINESMARRFFPSGSPIGKRWSYGDPFGPESPVIVGVVQDARYNRLRGSAPNMIYRLSDSVPDDVLSNFEVRTSVPPEQLVKTVSQALAEAEPATPVFDVVPLEVRLHRGIANDRLVAHLTAAFGIVALTLACLGLYGTISYGVARRVRELGVRMALGADRASVLWLVVREALVLVAFGAAIGLPLAFAASRGIASMLHGVRPIDPAAYAAGPLLLLVVATLAAYLPARRASRIDPMGALRAE
ncbi:MAG: ABC transporter permease, partial [Acidobacteriota bacterium]|nr:ABC transporter permease [Acidobacteriota bacterium]